MSQWGLVFLNIEESLFSQPDSGQEGGQPEVATQDYNALTNKPKLNGKILEGNVEETDPTVPAWAKAPTKPSYTPEEIGALAKDALVSLKTGELDEMWNLI